MNTITGYAYIKKEHAGYFHPGYCYSLYPGQDVEVLNESAGIATVRVTHFGMIKLDEPLEGTVLSMYIDGDQESGQHQATCPMCGGQLYITQATVSYRLPGIPIYEGGFDLEGGSSSDEMVECPVCHWKGEVLII